MHLKNYIYMLNATTSAQLLQKMCPRLRMPCYVEMRIYFFFFSFFFYFTRTLIVKKTGLTHIQRAPFCDNAQQELAEGEGEILPHLPSSCLNIHIHTQ